MKVKSYSISSLKQIQNSLEKKFDNLAIPAYDAKKKEDKKGIFNDENSGLIKFKFCSHTTNRLLYLFMHLCNIGIQFSLPLGVCDE